MAKFPPDYDLRRLRADRGLSLRAVAVLTGISNQEVSVLERGQRSPTLATVVKLAKGLDIDPATMQAILVATAKAREDGGAA